jgi:hypothetical protein
MDVVIPNVPPIDFQPVRVVFLGRDVTVGPIMALTLYLPKTLQPRVESEVAADVNGVSRFTMGVNVHDKLEMDLLHEFAHRNSETYEYMRIIPICVREDNGVPGPRPNSVCRCNSCKPPGHKMVYIYGPDGVLMSTMAAPLEKLHGNNLPQGCTLLKSIQQNDGMESLRTLWKKEKKARLARQSGSRRMATK